MMDHLVALRFSSSIDMVELKKVAELVANGELIIHETTWRVPKKHLDFGIRDVVRQFGQSRHAPHKSAHAIIGVYDLTDTEHLTKMVAAIIRAAGPHSYFDDIMN